MYVSNSNSIVLNPSKTTEIELCKAASRGDHEAITYLYNEYGNILFAICRRYANSLESAEDWFQDGFIRMLEKLKTFRGDSLLKTWMSRVMINFCITRLKEPRHKFQWHTLEDEMEIVDDTGDERWLEEITFDEVLHIIQSMPAGYRIVLNMYAVEGRKHAEIASVLNISESTSKTQLFKARKWMQNQMKGREVNNGK